MSIWKKNVTPEQLNEGSKGCMNEYVGIQVTEIGDDYLVATMPVDHRTKQPFGLLHGGASVVLAESLGSIAGSIATDDEHTCVGLEINANHLARVTEGVVKAVAKPAHIGNTTHVWEIRIYREDEKLVCISRITLAVIKKI